MAQVDFNYITLHGKQVRHYVFDYIHHNGRLRVYHLYVNLKENIFQLDYCSNNESWRTELDMSYKPKRWLESLGWSLSLFDSFYAIEEFLDCVASSIEHNKRCPYGLKVSPKFVERYDLEILCPIVKQQGRSPHKQTSIGR